MDRFSEHAQKSCLMADAPGLLYFDGGSYSSSLQDLGTPKCDEINTIPNQ
jgi:hypothetical protein